jgi:hypothetical protein
MKPQPKDKNLYNKVKQKIIFRNKKHSAYRSGRIVSEYKKQYKLKFGSGSAYTGDKSKGTLNRWMSEKWRNQRGEVGYKKKGDVYRPTKRISKDTPTTFNELSKKEIKDAMKEKRDKGRVSKFDKDGLKEKIVRIERPSVKGKKYTAIVKNISTGKERKISYGAIGFSQFKDSTPLKLYSSKDHGDEKRRQNYFSRHSGVKNKKEAIKKEIKKSKGFYNAKILSHKFLW